MVLIETFAWSVSGQSVSPHAVRTWRACRKAIDGECVGGWNETYAASLTVAGAILIVAGLALVGAHRLLRRRYSDLELRVAVRGPGCARLARCARSSAPCRRGNAKLARRELAVGTGLASAGYRVPPGGVAAAPVGSPQTGSRRHSRAARPRHPRATRALHGPPT
jgi:hypothetical protein